jgi:hypothetical protein
MSVCPVEHHSLTRPTLDPDETLESRLGVSEQVWTWHEDKNSCPCRESNPGLPAVAVLAELSRLVFYMH